MVKDLWRLWYRSMADSVHRQFSMTLQTDFFFNRNFRLSKTNIFIKLLNSAFMVENSVDPYQTALVRAV